MLALHVGTATAGVQVPSSSSWLRACSPDVRAALHFRWHSPIYYVGLGVLLWSYAWNKLCLLPLSKCVLYLYNVFGHLFGLFGVYFK